MAKILAKSKSIRVCGPTGWKTEFRPIKKGIITDEIDEFYGLGSCIGETPKLKDLDSRDPNAVIDFYLKVMRNDCSDKTKLRIVKLFNDGLVNFDDNVKTIQFTPKDPDL